MDAVGYFPGAGPEGEEEFRQFCRRRRLRPAAFLTGAQEEAFPQLLSCARGAAVVVPSAAVLGRDPAEACLRYFQVLARGGQVLSLASGGDLGRELLGLRPASPMADQVRRAMARLAVRGAALGRPPFGYRVGERRRLEVVPEEAEVVRLIFRLYVQEGLGLRRLAQRLNEMGARTRSGRLWTVAAVRDVLRNRVYLGTYRRFGVRVPANHPPLVSAQEFERAQRRLGAGQGGPRPRSALFPLSGLAYCGYCGGRMVGVRRVQRWRRRDGDIQHGEYRYYQCGSRVNRSFCDYHTWRAQQLEERVVEAVLAHGPEVDAAHGPPQEAELTRLLRRLSRLLAEVARGDLDEDQWRQAGVELVRRHLGADGAEARRSLERWRELTPEELGRCLHALVARVTVYDDDVQVALRR
ncbi:MAG TPA: recombinase family protein [Dehalococcoidia bacterium]|nr:recombinase family protein [Dehalococcoidia bacterium]